MGTSEPPWDYRNVNQPNTYNPKRLKNRRKIVPPVEIYSLKTFHVVHGYAVKQIMMKE